MRIRGVVFAIAVLAVAAAAAAGRPSAQESTVVSVAKGETAENVQEIATIVRVIGGVRQVSVDTEKSVVAVGGTAEQIALVQWLAGELTPPAGGSAPVNSAAHEYRVPGGDDVVRVFYLSRSATPQAIQEIATIVRSMSDIPRLMIYTAQAALTVRGTAGQVETAAWLIDEMGKADAAASASAGSHEYRVPSGGDDVVRLFYLSPNTTPQGLQEIATLVRTIGDIRPVFTYTERPALTVRGTAAQMELSAWLIEELTKGDAQTSAPAAAHEYRVPGIGDGVVRVFYLAPSETPQGLQKTASAVRSGANVRRVFTNSDRKAVVMRGTPEQVAVAERLIKEGQ